MGMKKFVLGITGGIGSGKSVFSDFFKNKDAVVVDADIISREVMKNPDVIKKICQAFPDCMSNGEMDRKKLRETVFSSEQKTAVLNSIVHGEIKKKCIEEIGAARSNVIFVVPLMFETGWDELCDATLVIASDKEERIKRIMSRDNINRTAALDVIARQMSDEDRIKKADYVIYNNDDVAKFKAEAENLLERLNFFEIKK